MIQLLEDMTIDVLDDHPILRQVIVNTHSPNFITHLTNDSGNKNVSVWLSKMVPYIIGESGIKQVIRCSRITPVTNTPTRSLFSQQDDKITTLDLADYLS